MSREDWKETTLGELITLEYGKGLTKKNRSGSGFPVYGSAGVVGFHKDYLVEGPAIIVGRKGTIGHVEWSVGNCFPIDTAFYVKVREDSVEVLDFEFCYFLLLALDLSRFNSQTGVPGLHRGTAYTAPVQLPPIEEQREIVNFMQALDLMIQAGDREISSAEQMRGDARQILLREAEEQWGVTSIADLTTFASGCSFPRSFQGMKSREYPFFKVADMNDPANYPSMGVSANWIDENARAELKAKLHPEGTVIFPKVGAALKTEKRRILERPSAFDNNIMGLIPTEDADPFFIFMAMENVELGPMSNPGPVPSVNQNTIRRVEIPAAPLEEQEKIVEKMQTLDAYLESAKRSQEALKQVRKDALHALLSGDKDVRELAEMFAINEDVA